MEPTAGPTQTSSEGSKYIHLNLAGHSTTESIQGWESQLVAMKQSEGSLTRKGHLPT